MTLATPPKEASNFVVKEVWNFKNSRRTEPFNVAMNPATVYLNDQYEHFGFAYKIFNGTIVLYPFNSFSFYFLVAFQNGFRTPIR